MCIREIFLPKEFEVSPSAMTDHVKTSAYVALDYIWRQKTVSFSVSVLSPDCLFHKLEVCEVCEAIRCS